ncbi:MAG: molybdenum cofactor biosynthesis protein MoaE [Acidobacteriota bacterium]
MTPSLLGISADPLDLTSLVRLALDDAPPGRFGAIATFVGTVRDQNLGRQVSHLEYEAYEPLAAKALDAIGREVAREWPSVRLAVRHRIGRLDPGDASVVVVAASPHRAEAFQACRFAIERIKQVVPIWKREVFEGGQAWLEGATADPADAAARAVALARARGQLEEQAG